MNITILCKVVDNFGDIGVVYRMAKGLLNESCGTKGVGLEGGSSVTEGAGDDNLEGESFATKGADLKCERAALEGECSSSKDSLHLNIVVDDLGAFKRIHSSVNEGVAFQQVDGMNIYNWNDYDFCYKAFSENDGELFGVVLECFQCGRPDWMEKILFEDKLERTIQIIMIDYLTAEKYAEDFHLLDSLTRSKKVQKVNFMPGFTEKTGGLVIGKDWKKWIENGRRKVDGPAMIFTYDRDWRGLAGALKEAGLKSVVAQGKGKDSFVKSCEAVDYKNFSELDFVDQEKWDDLMRESSVLFIRGEESMSRACLSGIPFVWHAYPQSDQYQMVKVNALLDRMSPHFTKEIDGKNDFEIVRQLWLDFNLPENEVNQDDFKAHTMKFLENRDKIAYGFEDFAHSLLKNGDLCSNLMTFIYKKVIL